MIMDFYTLSRKELQSLCKKNKIPANITNLAMADALTALPHVEGLDEFLNPTAADGGALATRHSVTRRKPESTKVNSRVQRGSRAKNVEVEQDSNVNVVVPPSNRRRKALTESTRRKKEVEVVVIDDDDGVQLKDVAKTPAALSSNRSRATGRTACGTTTSYNTRRSVRLLEKNLSNMTLTDTRGMAPNNLEQEMDNVSHQTQDSAETQKVNDAGDSLETVSILVTEKSDELEDSSLENNTVFEECQSQAVAKVKEGSGKLNGLEAESHDSNLKLDKSSETCDFSNECCDELANKSIATEEAVDENNVAGSDKSSELEIGTTQDALSVEAAVDATMAFAEQDDDALSVEVSSDADQYVAGSIPMLSESNDLGNLKELVECNTDNQGSNEDDDNKDKNNETSDGKYFQDFETMFDTDEKAEDETDLAIPEEVFDHQEEDLEAKSEYSEESMPDFDKMHDDSDVTGAKLAALEVSTESSADKRSMDAENVFLESSLVDVAVYEAEDLMDNPEKATFDISGTSSATLASEMDTTSENQMTVMDFCSEFLADKMDAENVTLESSLVDVVVHEAEDLKVNSANIEVKAQLQDSEEHTFDVCGTSSAILAAEIDATSENSMTDIEFCSDSSGDTSSIDAEKVTLESSLPAGVPEAGELKDDYEKLDFKAQAEKSEERAEAEELKDNSDKLYFKAQAKELKDNSEKLDFKAPAEESEEHAQAEELKDNSEKLDFKAPAEKSEGHAEAEYLKDNSEKLDFKAQAEVSEEHTQAEELKVNSEKLDFKAPAEESEGHAEAEYLKDNSEKLDFKAQAEVSSEEHAAGEESLDAASEFPSVLGGTCDPQIPQQISVESAGNSVEDSPDAVIMSGLSCYSNTLVDGDVTSEEIAIPKQESSVLAETVAVGPINDIPIQSVVADQLKGESLFPAQSETKEFANEIQTVPKMINTEENMPNVNMMKENLSTAELDKKSVRELKKMLKNLTLDGKPNCKSKTTNVVKEVEKKRTALQALPENRMTNGEAQNDG